MKPQETKADAPGGSRPLSNAFEILAVAVMILAGTLLRCADLGGKTVWLDEAFSVWLANHGWKDLVAWVVRVDQHPPLYYLLLKAWVSLFGDSESAVRSLSVVMSAGALPLFYFAARRLAGRLTALFGLAFLSFSAFHLQYAQEARMYALLVFEAAAGLYFLSEILVHKEKAGAWAWAGLVLSQTAIMWTHNIGAIFFPLAVNASVVAIAFLRNAGADGPAGRGFWKKWILCQSVALLLWLPWLPAFMKQTFKLQQDFWISAPTWGSVYGTFQEFQFGFLPWDMKLKGLWNALFFLLSIAGIVSLRKKPAALITLLFLFWGPVAGELTASLVRPIFLGRTLIPFTLAYYMLAGAGLAFLVRGFRTGRPATGLRAAGAAVAGTAVAAVLCLLIGLVTASGFVIYYKYYEKEDWRGAAAFVAANLKPGDLVVFNATWTQIPFEYYFRHYGRKNRMKGLPVDLFDRGVLEPKMTDADIPYMAGLLSGEKRVCLVYSHDWFTDPESIIGRSLSSLMRPAERMRFNGVQVSFYEAEGSRWAVPEIRKRLEKLPTKFVYRSEGAKSVHLAGSFNHWELEEAYAMTKGSGGAWRLTANLPQGENEYVFIVDRTIYLRDPANPRTSPGRWGFTNSLVSVTR